MTHHLDTSNLEPLIRKILSVKEEDISCDECYVAIDQYVDMIRAGKDAAAVLPHVKEHLSQCNCCATEFKALIAILEAASDAGDK